MKKFIFNDITIYEAWEQFIHDIGQEYELKCGTTVIIESVGLLVKKSFPALDYKKDAAPDFNPSNGELNLDKYIGSSPEMFGFAVTVKTKPDKRGAYNVSYRIYISPI